MNKYLIAPWRSLDDDDRNEDNHEDVDDDEEVADFPAVFFHICNFDICNEIQLPNTNTKG